MAVLVLVTLSGALPALEAATDPLIEIQALLAAGDADGALRLIEGAYKRGKLPAEALLARSTAHFMLGELEAGTADLDRALELDPTLRQGWLNRAALEISEGRLDRALEALAKAREIDPRASDNDLNTGAVLLMQGKAQEAGGYFERYLGAEPGSAEATYSVASNYAMLGYVDPAVRHLSDAIALDEKVRLRARTDPNFAAMAGADAFRRLLSDDGYRLPPGSHTATQRFDVSYQGGRGRLLNAVLDVVQLSGGAFERRAEVTDDWALVWADMRIKVTAHPEGGGLIELSAPRDRFSDQAWRQRSEIFLRGVRLQLAKR